MSPQALGVEKTMTEKNKKNLRRVLMWGGVLAVLLTAAVLYVFSGRYMTTDNAYVKAEKIMLSADVSGRVLPVRIGDNRFVKAGTLLFEIDPSAYDIAVQKAEAGLRAVRMDIEEVRATYHQKEEELKIAEAVADYANTEFERQRVLSAKEAVAKSRLDEATKDYNVARATVAQLRQEMAVELAKLEGDPDIAVENHPLYKAALATLETARLDLARTKIYAPADGYTGTMPRGGDYANAGVPMMSFVSDRALWIEANFKETELTRMQPGQKVRIAVDTYPGRIWQGTVESISPATGSEFSVLPAQNATGNWVKVVQRVAVRIVPEQAKEDPPLRTGMSAEVRVDTGSYPHLPVKSALAGMPFAGAE